MMNGELFGDIGVITHSVLVYTYKYVMIRYDVLL
jgi:hypothetical protein